MLENYLIAAFSLLDPAVAISGLYISFKWIKIKTSISALFFTAVFGLQLYSIAPKSFYLAYGLVSTSPASEKDQKVLYEIHEDGPPLKASVTSINFNLTNFALLFAVYLLYKNSLKFYQKTEISNISSNRRDESDRT